MSATEIWTCDSCYETHAHEEEARERGWVKFERDQMRETVLRAIGDLPERRLPARMHHDEAHICSSCLEWSFDSIESTYGRWTIFDEDMQAAFKRARDKWWVTDNKHNGGWRRVHR